jgi:hypothetical protein
MAVDDLREAQREAQLEAAPFAFLIVVANGGLAVTSQQAGWQLFGSDDWWIWGVLAIPSAALVVTLALGFARLRLDHRRRQLAIALLGLLGLGTAAAIVCLVVSLTHWTPAGLQLLASAGVVLLTNVVTFGLVFWELDEGGPVARALEGGRNHPDFQFPQDENPQLARPSWAPELVDYVYLSVTNSIAFSPTDAMPLTHRAKVFMALEAAVSALTVLVVAGRAINILS